MINEIYYSLPYSVRRLLYARLRSKDFQRMQEARSIVSDAGYSLKPFDQNRCIFVHIPKAAGVSVCRALFDNLAGGHNSIKKYQLVFSKEEFDSYFKFTFVRNPWSRLFSAYNFLKKGGMNDADRSWASANLSSYTSFDDFVMRWLTVSNIEKYTHFMPQYRFLCLPNSDELNVDFLGFFENIQEDFLYVRHRLFLSGNLTLKHDNKTEPNDKKIDFREFYTNEARDIVSEVYKKDVDLFGYNFDNSSLRTQLTNRST